MNAVFRAIGMSKQNFHQRLDRYLVRQDEQAQMVKVMHQVRQDHPAMGAASMYRLLAPKTMGRDRFEAVYQSYGFVLEQKRNHRITTDSRGVPRFENLLVDIELTGVNQAFSSDITYYQIGDRFYYLTFILDLYSRYIRGYSVSKTLATQMTTLPALQMALKGLKSTQTQDLIIHSDGGGQYYAKAFTALTAKAGMRNSMCTSVYENAHAERINGTIKNSYLKHFDPQDFKSLQIETKRAVNLYNNERPHQALGGLSPRAFEQTLLSYPHSFEFLTKKKEAKKKGDDDSNLIFESTSKTVNCI
jgi:putative transposase